MTLEYWHGERLLWAETDEDREVILTTIGPPADTLRQCTHAEVIAVYRELLRRVRARPPPYSVETPAQPGA